MSNNQLTKKLGQIRNLLKEERNGIEKGKNGETRPLSRKERSKKVDQAIWIVDSILRDKPKIFLGGTENVSTKRRADMSI